MALRVASYPGECNSCSVKALVRQALAAAVVTVCHLLEALSFVVQKVCTLLTRLFHLWSRIDIDIFVNCSWVDTRCQ
jgi:hypothetical protein